MADDELFANVGADLVNTKALLTVGNVRVEHDLKQDVAELLTKDLGIVFVDTLNKLIGFLEESAAQSLMRLLGIPRASVGRTKDSYDLDEIIKVIGIF
jgi:hypothetical protein